MTHITNYQDLLANVYAKQQAMHQQSNWTAQMEAEFDRLEKKYQWIANRVKNLEEMNGYNDIDQINCYA